VLVGIRAHERLEDIYTFGQESVGGAGGIGAVGFGSASNGCCPFWAKVSFAQPVFFFFLLAIYSKKIHSQYSKVLKSSSFLDFQ
jgi:hypothetical protein